ncbi:MAG: pyruvate kinase, partial [Clostridia bacterium]
MSGRRTKIVATLGPASSTPDVLLAIIRAGADVLRLNLSHADAGAVSQVIDMLTDLERQHDVHPALLLDTGGPEVRVTGLPDAGRRLESGETVRFGDGEECVHLT